mgnify:CR=1 FL=1
MNFFDALALVMFRVHDLRRRRAQLAFLVEQQDAYHHWLRRRGTPPETLTAAEYETLQADYQGW